MKGTPMDIPYDIEPRPSTGLHNARLGVLLFIASETMLFGALMTSYVFLRSSATDWTGGAGPPGAAPSIANTILMAASSAALILGRSQFRRGNPGRCRAMLFAAMALGLAYIAVTVFTLDALLAKGIHPATSTYAGIFFVLTGLHALHVAGGMVVLGMLLTPRADVIPGRFRNRLGDLAVYWHFLTAVWLVTFPALYLP